MGHAALVHQAVKVLPYYLTYWLLRPTHPSQCVCTDDSEEVATGRVSYDRDTGAAEPLPWTEAWETYAPPLYTCRNLTLATGRAVLNSNEC